MPNCQRARSSGSTGSPGIGWAGRGSGRGRSTSSTGVAGSAGGDSGPAPASPSAPGSAGATAPSSTSKRSDRRVSSTSTTWLRGTTARESVVACSHSWLSASPVRSQASRSSASGRRSRSGRPSRSAPAAGRRRPVPSGRGGCGTAGSWRTRDVGDGPRGTPSGCCGRARPCSAARSGSSACTSSAVLTNSSTRKRSATSVSAMPWTPSWVMLAATLRSRSSGIGQSVKRCRSVVRSSQGLQARWRRPGAVGGRDQHQRGQVEGRRGLGEPGHHGVETEGRGHDLRVVQRGAAADHQVAALGVGDGQPARPVGVQVERGPDPAARPTAGCCGRSGRGRPARPPVRRRVDRRLRSRSSRARTNVTARSWPERLRPCPTMAAPGGQLVMADWSSDPGRGVLGPARGRPRCPTFVP